MNVRVVTYFIWAAVLALLVPIFLAGVQLFYRLFASGLEGRQAWNLWVDRTYDMGTPLFWVMVASGALFALIWSCVAAIGGYETDRYGYRDRSYDGNNATKTVASVGAVLFAVVLVLAIIVVSLMNVNNKDHYRFNNESTTFAVQDLDSTPGSLERLLDGAERDENDPDDPDDDVLIGSHDVPSRTVSDDFQLLEQGWDERSASLAGALTVMERTSGESQRVQLLPETASHLYLDNEDGDSVGMWTAIRDGSGKHTPLEGVVQWDGRSQRASQCRFEGDYEIDRAFNGENQRDLRNLIAEEFPDVRFRLSDVYGYCDTEDGNQPVIVMPTYQNVRYGSRHEEAPGGVIIMRGSPEGEPDFEFIVDVEPGDLPGPVYALSIAETQREQHVWAAGRKWQDNDFGFEETSAASQTGNATEFLLRSVEDGRLYWATPLTPRGSDSEQVLAFSAVPADQVAHGELNEMTIFAFNGDNPLVNLEQMQGDIESRLSRDDPGFLSSGGKLQEFTPASGSTWRVFGVRDDGVPRLVATYDGAEGRIIDITYLDETGVSEEDSSDGDTAPSDGDEPTTDGQPTEPTGNPCDGSLSELSNEQLAACNAAVSEELGRRLQPEA